MKMTPEQAMEYIDSIISNYNNPVCIDKSNYKYRLCQVWLSEKDIEALLMAKEALKEMANDRDNQTRE